MTTNPAPSASADIPIIHSWDNNAPVNAMTGVGAGAGAGAGGAGAGGVNVAVFVSVGGYVIGVLTVLVVHVAVVAVGGPQLGPLHVAVFVTGFGAFELAVTE